MRLISEELVNEFHSLMNAVQYSKICYKLPFRVIGNELWISKSWKTRVNMVDYVGKRLALSLWYDSN